MLTYFPPIRPYKKHSLAVDKTHQIYVEECGNPEGLPIIFLHGGPGLGCTEDHRRYFDPTVYHIILFDQRGCGRSTPHGVVENNNTAHTIADMECIREYLNVEKWLLFGGSWGSALALAYAQQYPERVIGMILRSIFLAREQDIAWLTQGMQRIFPDYWHEMVAHLADHEKQDVFAAFEKRISGKDELMRMSAAKAWATCFARCSTLAPNHKLVEAYNEPSHVLALARICLHYMHHRYFLSDNQLLNNMQSIRHIPSIIIHGRYDIICPIDNAWQLHHALPNSQLQIIRDAGHSAIEPLIIDALIHATISMGQKYFAA